MVGNLIREMRKEMGLSQRELGEKLGVGRTTVSAWETDRNDPSLAMFLQLLYRFNTFRRIKLILDLIRGGECR